MPNATPNGDNGMRDLGPRFDSLRKTTPHVDRERGSELDYAKRAYEAITLDILAKGEEAWGCWKAINLTTGEVDSALYPTRLDAIAHQLHPTSACYLIIPPSGVTYKEIKEYLDLSRDMYEKGARLPSHGEYGMRGFKL